MDIVQAFGIYSVLRGDSHHSVLLLLLLLLIKTLIIKPPDFFRLVVFVNTEIIKALIISSRVLKDSFAVIEDLVLISGSNFVLHKLRNELFTDFACRLMGQE